MRARTDIAMNDGKTVDMILDDLEAKQNDAPAEVWRNCCLAL